MLSAICPKLPMRSKSLTKDFYIRCLGFSEVNDYGNYLILSKNAIEIHFFEFRDLDPHTNYGQVYIRVMNIESLYKSLLDKKVSIHPAGTLQIKPWQQKEFSLLDPDNNLLTFGEAYIRTPFS